MPTKKLRGRLVPLFDGGGSVVVLRLLMIAMVSSSLSSSFLHPYSSSIPYNNIRRISMISPSLVRSTLSSSRQQHGSKSTSPRHGLYAISSPNNDDDNNNNSNVRKISMMNDNNNQNLPSPKRLQRLLLGGIASLGMIETAYLTFMNNGGGASSSLLFCSASASNTNNCGSVLTGPYAYIPNTDIPLSAMGFLAYTLVAVLALYPLFVSSSSSSSSLEQREQQSVLDASNNNDDNMIVDNNATMEDDADTTNRLALTVLTSTMAIFSMGLISILVFVLHQSCLYCFTSAALSIALAVVSWFGGDGGAQNRGSNNNVIYSASGGIMSIVSTFLLVANVNNNSENTVSMATTTTDKTSSSAPMGRLLASTATSSSSSSIITSDATKTLFAATTASSPDSTKPPPIMALSSPPAITTDSSDVAIQLARELQSLDATLYGAFWCGHCYDQKQTFGKQAMERYIPYIECSKDGINAQVAMCKEKKIPGYPTWEIAGKLYPGEQALDELQTIVTTAKQQQQQQQSTLSTSSTSSSSTATSIR